MCHNSKNTKQVLGKIFLNKDNILAYRAGSRQSIGVIGSHVSFRFYNKFAHHLRQLNLYNEGESSLKCNLETVRMLFADFHNAAKAESFNNELSEILFNNHILPPNLAVNSQNKSSVLNVREALVNRFSIVRGLSFFRKKLQIK